LNVRVGEVLFGRGKYGGKITNYRKVCCFVGIGNAINVINNLK
jgi:hypothetical protein